jgi:preprotein translocase subunit SecF
MKPFNVFPYDSNFNFMRLRWMSLAIALLIMFVAIGAMIANGLSGGGFDRSRIFNLALDFSGGALVELRFDKPVEVDDIRKRLATAGYHNAQVQSLGAGNDLSIRQKAEHTENAAVVGKLTEDMVSAVTIPGNPVKVLRSETVGSQVGKELAENGIWALVFVVVGVLIYISFGF